MTIKLKLDALQFPNPLVADADPRAFDAYDESLTWLPVLGGDGGASGQTYVTQKGTCTRIGRIVVVTFDIACSVIGTTIGTLAAITGLPIAPAAGFGNFGGTISYGIGFASNIQAISCYANSGNLIYLNGSATTGTSPLANLAKAVLASGVNLTGSVIYLV